MLYICHKPPQSTSILFQITWNVQPWNLIIHFYYLYWQDRSSSCILIFIPVLRTSSHCRSTNQGSYSLSLSYSSLYIKYIFRIHQEMAKGKWRIKFILYNFLHRPNLYYFRNCHFSQKKLLKSRDKKMFLSSEY